MRTAFLCLLLAACGGGSNDDDDIPDHVLTGVVGGNAWTFAQGHVDFVGQTTGEFHVALYGESYDTCGQPDATELLLTSFPPEPGSYPFDLQQNLTFVNDEGGPVNKIATDGLLVIEDVAEATVTGRLRARFDGDNDVAGSFELATCIVPAAPLDFEACSFDTPPPVGDGDPPAVQAVAAAPNGNVALIDSTGAVLTYGVGGGIACSVELVDTIALPSPAEAIDYDAASILYIHTIDRLYRYDGGTRTLDCGAVSAATEVAIASDGATAYSIFVNSVDRVAIDAVDCSGAVWTPGNAFSVVHGIAVAGRDDRIHVGGLINGEVQVLAFDEAGVEQFRYGGGDLTRAASLGECGMEFCVLDSSWIAVYDGSGVLVGRSNIADVVTVEAGFLATDLAFPPGGGPGYLGVSAQRIGSFDVEAQLYRAVPE